MAIYDQNGAGYAQNGSEGGGGTVTAADITDATATGRAVLTAADATAAQSAIGLQPRIAPGSLLHLWRLGATPYADFGSSPVAMTETGSTWVNGRTWTYVIFDATAQTSPAGATDRISATLSDVPAGADITIGCTVGKDPLISYTPASGNWIFGLGDDEPYSGGVSGSWFSVQCASATEVILGTALSGDNKNSSNVAVDWSKPHRFEITYVSSTRVAVLYVDGVSAATITFDPGTMPALTDACFGGYGGSIGLTGASCFEGADFSIELTALSAAQVKERFNSVRRYFR